MKKHRRLINKTDHSFFSNADFKLKSTQLHKQRPRRSSNILSHLKNHMFSDDSKSLLKDKSKQKRNYLENIHFCSTQQENFKLPKSLTKRSKLKTNEEDQRTKMQSKFSEISQLNFKNTSMISIEKVGNQKQKYAVDYMILRRSKGVSSRQMKKAKIEKSALQRYNMINNQNSEKQSNHDNQQKAQALFLLLQSNRKAYQNKNNKGSHYYIEKFSKRYQDNHEQQQKSLTSLAKLNQKDHYSQQKDQQINKKYRQANIPKPKQKAKQFKNVVCEIQSEKQQFEQSYNNQQSSQIYQKDDQSLPKTLQKQQYNKVSHKDNEIPLIESKKYIKQSSNTSIQPKINTKKQLDERNNKPSLQHKRQQHKSNNLILDKKIQKISQKNINNDKIPQKSVKLIKQTNLQIQKMKDNQQNEKQVKKIIQKNKKQFSIQEIQPIIKEKIYEIPKQSKQKSQKNIRDIGIDSIPQAKAYTKQPSAKLIKTTIEDQNIKKIVNQKSKQNSKNQQLDRKLTINKKNTTVKTAGIDKGKIIQSQYDEQQLQEISIGIKKPKESQKQGIYEEKKAKQQKNIQKIQPKIQLKKVPIEKQQMNKGSKKLVSPPILTPLPKQQIPLQKQTFQQNFEQEQSQESPLDQFIYYMQRLEDIGQYRMKSKDLYSDKSIDRQLFQIHKICTYYIAHQFLYLTKITQDIIKERPITKQYYNLTVQELNQLQENGDLDAELETIENNLEQSKKLLKKCYDQCKSFLKKQQQILILDAKTNYHLKSCSYLIQQFKKVYQLYFKNTKNTVMLKRCIYLIQIYGILKTFNNEEIKEYEQFEDIKDPVKHLQQYKTIFI